MKKYITPNVCVVALVKEDIMTLSASESSVGNMKLSWYEMFADDGLGME